MFVLDLLLVDVFVVSDGLLRGRSFEGRIEYRPKLQRGRDDVAAELELDFAGF